MGIHIPAAVRDEIDRRIKDEISDWWYHGGAERVALWAYRTGRRDEQERGA